MYLFKTSRVFAESPGAVFAAFASPERLANWWGPDGFSNTFDVFEFKPGGRWCFTMHGPDGANYPNESVFVEIEPAKKIVLKHTCEPFFELTIQFDSVQAGTLVTWEQVFESAEFAESVKHIIEPANEQNLTRWQNELSTV
jgi:uncharacterized protein YndB with AHSA1/START domain